LILKKLLNFQTKFINHCSTYIELKVYLVVTVNSQRSRVYEIYYLINGHKRDCWDKQVQMLTARIVFWIRKSVEARLDFYIFNIYAILCNIYCYNIYVIFIAINVILKTASQYQVCRHQ